MKPRSPFGFGVVALVAAVGCFIAAGMTKLPDRSAVEKLEGVVATATKTTSSKRGVSYSMTVKTADGKSQSFTLQAGQATEDEVRSIIGEPVVIEKDYYHVYSIASNGRTVLSFEQSVATAQASVGNMRLAGGIAIGLGLALCALGVVRGRRASRPTALPVAG